MSNFTLLLYSKATFHPGSIWAAFSRRLQTQFQQLQTLIQTLQRGEGSDDDATSPLVRDYFGLHKIIVLVTDVGKVCIIYFILMMTVNEITKRPVVSNLLKYLWQPINSSL